MRDHICVIAGEPSGDFLGEKLIYALKEAHPACHFSGVGGYLMRGAGLQSLFSYEQLAVMGVAEVLPKLPSLYARIRQTVNHIKQTKPDVVVTIDSPDFSFRVAKAVRREMANPPKLVHYVAPTVWAWREGRAEKISKFLDGLICLFDFEPKYFQKYGLNAQAVGHPLVERDAMNANGDLFREEVAISPTETVVGVMFGSRRGELKRTGPILRDAALLLGSMFAAPPPLVIPTLPHVKSQVMQMLKEYPGAVHVMTEPQDKYNAFKSVDIALAVSGTVGLELAALEVPHVIAYKMNPITAAVVRRMVKVKYAHLANIMADKAIVPEFIQENARPELIAKTAFDLYKNPVQQKKDFAGIKHRLGWGEEKTPSQKAAAFVLGFLQ